MKIKGLKSCLFNKMILVLIKLDFNLIFRLRSLLSNLKIKGLNFRDFASNCLLSLMLADIAG